MKKQQKFEEIQEKFIKKCVQNRMYPTVVLNYKASGIFPELTYVKLSKKQQEEISSSLKQSSN